MSTAANPFDRDLAVAIPPTVVTLESFLDWAHSPDFPQTGTISYINGKVLIDMSPERIDSHTRLKSDLHAQLYALVERLNLGEVFVDGALVVNREADVANEPDIVFCSWESLRSGRVKYVSHPNPGNAPNQIEGSPTLVVELISPSSTRKDRVLLREGYFLAGIEEYWLIDARKPAALKFDLLVRGPQAYVSAERCEDDSLLSNVLGHWVSVARFENEFGSSKYKFGFRSIGQ